MLLRLSIVFCLMAIPASSSFAQTVVNGAYGPIVVPSQPMMQQQAMPMQQPQQFIQQQPQQFIQQQPQQFMQQQPQQFMQQQPQQFMQQPQQFQQQQQQFGNSNLQQQRRQFGGKILNFIANEIQPAQPGANNTGAQILGMIGNHLNPQQQQQQLQQQQQPGVQRVPGGFYSQQSNGINNQSTYHADSAFAAGREAGKANSNFQRTTIVDANGNAIGYNDTQTWKNAQTNQLHYNSKSCTPNSAGGVDNRTSFGLGGR